MLAVAIVTDTIPRSSSYSQLSYNNLSSDGKLPGLSSCFYCGATRFLETRFESDWSLDRNHLNMTPFTGDSNRIQQQHLPLVTQTQISSFSISASSAALSCSNALIQVIQVGSVFGPNLGLGRKFEIIHHVVNSGAVSQ